MHPQVVAPDVRRESTRVPPSRVGLTETLGGGSQFALAALARSGPSGPGYFASFAKVVHRPKAAFRNRIGRLRAPLIVPNADEREGYVPNVVYSCGSLLHGGQLIIPYGTSDHTTTFATAPLDEVLDAMQ